MNMTHYMELLADRQPWNLLLFMAVPVILAETVAITELFILWRRATTGTLARINRAASLAGGFYFVGVFVHLMSAAVWQSAQRRSSGWAGATPTVPVPP